jgi:sec-independent protein translocase protein TatC
MTQDTDQDYDALKEQPFISHLVELRDRLIRIVAVVLLIFLCLFPWANDIYIMVASPLMAHLPEGTSMIATEVASPFLTPFKLSLVAAMFLSMPYSLFQLWSFIAPGLYKHEKRMVVPLVVSSTILFYLGMVFAYYVVFPLVFGFLTGTVPDGVTVATDIGKYLDFVLTLFFAFGMAFEVPIATIILVSMGITTPDSLTDKRPYIIVGAFCVGMLLTPPDVISQTLLALPMLILFELGVFFSRIIQRRKGEQDECDTDPDDSNPDGSGSPGSGAEPADTDADAGEQAESRPEKKPGRQPQTAGIAAAEMAELQPDETPGQQADEEIITGPADDMLSLDGDRMFEEDRFTPMTEEELDLELGNVEAELEEGDEGAYVYEDYYEDEDEDDEDYEDCSLGEDDDEGEYEDLLNEKLQQARGLIDEDETVKSRDLLNDVLNHGNTEQEQAATAMIVEIDAIVAAAEKAVEEGELAEDGVAGGKEDTA